MKSISPPSPRKALYEALGLPDGASIDSVKKAFKRIALEHHPDKNNGVENEIFTKAKYAWHILTNPTYKKLYDEEGEDPTVKESIIQRESTKVIQQLLQKVIAESTNERNPIIYSVKQLLTNEQNILSKAESEIKQQLKLKTALKKNIEAYWKKGEQLKAFSMGTLENTITGLEHTAKEVEMKKKIVELAFALIKDVTYELPVPKTTQQPSMQINPFGNSWIVFK